MFSSMNRSFNLCAVSAFFFSFAVPTYANADECGNTHQVAQVARWFTGEFDNAQQVAADPQTPALTMSNCRVAVPDFAEPGARTVYLEQFVVGNPAPLRARLYVFRRSEDVGAVTVSVFRFVDQSGLLGMCGRPAHERVIEASNVAGPSCDLDVRRSGHTYAGDNAPEGCPTSFPGGKVVSEVSIRRNEVDSLDRIFDANGTPIAGTPIEFRRIDD
jgi:hypothetical protein